MVLLQWWNTSPYYAFGIKQLCEMIFVEGSIKSCRFTTFWHWVNELIFNKGLDWYSLAYNK